MLEVLDKIRCTKILFFSGFFSGFLVFVEWFISSLFGSVLVVLGVLLVLFKQFFNGCLVFFLVL